MKGNRSANVNTEARIPLKPVIPKVMMDQLPWASTVTADPNPLQWQLPRRDGNDVVKPLLIMRAKEICAANIWTQTQYGNIANELKRVNFNDGDSKDWLRMLHQQHFTPWLVNL